MRERLPVFVIVILIVAEDVNNTVPIVFMSTAHAFMFRFVAENVYDAVTIICFVVVHATMLFVVAENIDDALVSFLFIIPTISLVASRIFSHKKTSFIF